MEIVLFSTKIMPFCAIYLLDCVNKRQHEIIECKFESRTFSNYIFCHGGEIKK